MYTSNLLWASKLKKLKFLHLIRRESAYLPASLVSSSICNILASLKKILSLQHNSHAILSLVDWCFYQCWQSLCWHLVHAQQHQSFHDHSFLCALCWACNAGASCFSSAQRSAKDCFKSWTASTVSASKQLGPPHLYLQVEIFLVVLLKKSQHRGKAKCQI